MSDIICGIILMTCGFLIVIRAAMLLGVWKCIQYTVEELEERVAEINKGGVILSFQYSMVMLLNQDNEILLRLDPLVSREEALEHS